MLKKEKLDEQKQEEEKKSELKLAGKRLFLLLFVGISTFSL